MGLAEDIAAARERQLAVRAALEAEAKALEEERVQAREAEHSEEGSAS